MIVFFQMEAYLKMENGEKVRVRKSQQISTQMSTVSLRDADEN